jgi:hypothetical protein
LGHNLEQLGTATLDTMGGLITNCNPQDLPEGASPRCWDVDFITGSVFTRAGLQSAYSYAGQSIGPNTAGTGTSQDVGNADWINPSGVTGSSGYASVVTGAVSPNVIPLSNVGTGSPAWTNPANIVTTGVVTGGAYVALSAAHLATSFSGFVVSTDNGFAVPSGATVQGVALTLKAQATPTAGAGTTNLIIRMVNGGLPVGTAGSQTINNISTVYPLGSNVATWGATLTPALLNSATFGFEIQASLYNPNVSTASVTVYVNDLSITVYYTGDGSNELLAQTFSFAIPSTAGIVGLGTTFTAYSNNATTLTAQLLKNGVPVGIPKTQVLNSTPTTYTLPLGNTSDLWGSTWLYSDLNNTDFGVQFSVSGAGTTNVQNVQTQVYIATSAVNFNYIKSYELNNNQTFTLALDASGIMWQEDVSNNPDQLSLLKSGFLPGSFAKSATMNNKEHICFSDLSIGTDRPRVYNGTAFDPLSQVGPGAPPSFKASTGSGTGTLDITSYSLTSDIVTFIITTAPTPVVGALYTINNVVSYLNGNSYQVLATPAPTSTSFSVSLAHADDPGGSVTGTAVPAFSYSITSITQNAAVYANGQELLWSAPGNPSSPGDTITVYYAGQDLPEDPTLLRLLGQGIAVYVYFTPATPIVGGGTYLVAGHGINHPPSESGGVHGVPYIAVQYTSTGNARYGGPGGSGPNGPGNTGYWQITLATCTTDSAISDLSAGDGFSITGATPGGWNSNWNVVIPVASTTLDITSTQMSALGVATYGWSIAAGTPPGVLAPVPGQVIIVQGCTNSSVFNTQGVIASVTGSSSGTLTVDGFPAGAIPFQGESGTAVTEGTSFYFDPGAVTVGSSTNPIYGNDTGTGFVTIVGGALQPIGSGTRQGVVFFITENGYETAPSSPVTFTTSDNANFITASFIPIGPPNVIARGIAFTEAGQNGVPGSNFYVIEQPVTVAGINPQQYTSTIINDNTTTTAKFTFTDAVLLKSREIDVQGDNLFNLIELGSSAWCVPYSQRMFYGLQLNKVDNFNNLSFDGGYLPNPGGNIQPLGWNIVNPIDQTLLISTVTGMSLYIQNQNGSTQDTGLITQTAFQDAYQVPIIKPATTYSVRVACSAPSGLTTGTLIIDLSDLTQQTAPYGSFSVPLASMSTFVTPFTGTLLTVPFATAVPSGLLLRVRVANCGSLADCEIDRIEVFETKTPYLKAQVYGSYPGQPESIDGSSEGGVIDTTSENAQACFGGFVLHDLFYLLKTGSMYSIQDNPNSEPGGWGLHEVSNKVGTVGIRSYDVGEEWAVTACRAGIFGFNGGQPVKIMQEIWNLWECINWDAGETIVLRNDVVSKRMYCAIPLPTGTDPVSGKPLPSVKWLPNAPYNPTPTTPNVMLMLNYQGLATFEEMISSPQIHTTMFGTLAAPDMKRKWAIWNIAMPDMEFIIRADSETQPLYICNGIDSSKIYILSQSQLSDDGAAINSLYTTYGFVNAAKAATLPIFGFHAKRYTVLQAAVTGVQTVASTATNMNIRILPNTISPKYPYTVPVGIPLVDPAGDDYFRPINVRGNRAFIEVSTNAVGSAFQLSKLLLTGKADPWATLNPTGGGNMGIV